MRIMSISPSSFATDPGFKPPSHEERRRSLSQWLVLVLEKKGNLALELQVHPMLNMWSNRASADSRNRQQIISRLYTTEQRSWTRRAVCVATGGVAV